MSEMIFLTIVLASRILIQIKFIPDWKTCSEYRLAVLQLLDTGL
jgi:hypothetical protein